MAYIYYQLFIIRFIDQDFLEVFPIPLSTPTEKPLMYTALLPIIGQQVTPLTHLAYYVSVGAILGIDVGVDPAAVQFGDLRGIAILTDGMLPRRRRVYFGGHSVEGLHLDAVDLGSAEQMIIFCILYVVFSILLSNYVDKKPVHVLYMPASCCIGSVRPFLGGWRLTKGGGPKPPPPAVKSVSF